MQVLLFSNFDRKNKTGSGFLMVPHIGSHPLRYLRELTRLAVDTLDLRPTRFFFFLNIHHPCYIKLDTSANCSQA